MTNPNDPIFSKEWIDPASVPEHNRKFINGQAIPLTKREWFAGLAMQGLIYRAYDFSMATDVSDRAIALADSLIAELSKEVKA